MKTAIKVISNQLETSKTNLKALEPLLAENKSTSLQKQDYIKYNAKIEVYEGILDLLNGLLEKE